MSQEAIGTPGVAGPPSSSSPLRTQRTESDLNTTQSEDVSGVLNLFVSVTNSESAGNHFSLRVDSFRRNSGRNRHQAEPCRHGISEPHRCSDTEEEESIIDVPLSQLLRGPCHELQDLTDAWISTYESSHFEALRLMLELLLHATGPLKRLTKEQALKLEQLTPEAYNAWVAPPEAKPLILEDMFLENFLNFLKATISGDICTDMLIMKRIYRLLEVFVHSTWVSSRYAALMISSLITVQCSLYWVELDAEMHDVLVTENESSLQEKIDMVKDFFEQFIEIVNLCQRDVILTVRKLARQIFCSWCHRRLDLLMTDKYLRYLYWSLYDDSSSIRSLAVVTCASLYKSEYVVKNMKKFVEKTLGAIVKRAQDENNRVATLALDTVIGLSRRVPWMLKEINLEHIYILIFAQEEFRSQRAAELIHSVFDEMSSSNMQFIFHTVLFTEESLVELGEDVDVASAVTVMLENLFRTCRLELTDWPAWRELLLGGSLDRSDRLRRLACLLLIEIINLVSTVAEDRFFVEADFPLAPSTSKKARKPEKMKSQSDERLQSECLNLLVRLTGILGPKLTLIWEKYKDDQECLTHLVKIPQYFNGSIDFLDVPEMSCTLVYLRDFMVTSPALEALHRSLACLYHLMAASGKWRQQAPALRNVLFKPVTRQFLKAVKCLAKQPITNQVRAMSLKVVKDCFYLSKFFDVTKTCLLDETLIALRYGIGKKSAEIVCPTMTMCLYVLEWQLKDLEEGELTADERSVLMYKIQSQSRTLFIQLDKLITVQKTVVRESAYSVMCRLLTTFCRFNAFASPYHLIHMPRLPLLTQEWLNYNLACLVPRDHIPEDEEKYQTACTALQQFCDLLATQVVHISYISSVLPLFQFHKQLKNYNRVLLSSFATMAGLDRNMTFPDVLIESLIWMKTNTKYNVEEMTKGVCGVLLRLRPARLVVVMAVEIIGYGLSQIHNRTHYFVFKLLAYFAVFLETKSAERFYNSVRDTFHLYTETDDVKAFLDALSKRIQKNPDQQISGVSA